MNIIQQKFGILSNLNSNFVTVCGSFFITAGLSTLAWAQWKKKEQEARIVKLRPNRLIVVTGCDSGLGLSMAYWAGKKGYQVLAGCYSETSDGAKFLRKVFQNENKLHIIGVDVTNKNCLENLRRQCENILIASQGQTKLWALIPNAAVSGFGEFFWQTEDQVQRIMDVNFWGTVNLTQEFHPLLLQHKSRVIVISSDCADYPLPGLAVYCASKAALETWATSLRLEVAKYGVSVVSLQPGKLFLVLDGKRDSSNFPKQTNLFVAQRKYYEDMETTMSKEDKLFYGDYFEKYNDRMIKSFGSSQTPSTVEPLQDSTLVNTFFTLLENDIRFTSMVTLNPAFLKVYNFLVRNTPTRIADVLTHLLMRVPAWSATAYPRKNDTKADTGK